MNASASGLAAVASRLREAAAPLLAPGVWTHAARTAIAALLALWFAFALQLDTPYSAMTTVMIVANPVQGMILEKSLYRLGGTLLGGLAGVALMALFAQAPVLFLLGFAAWMALCTAASTLLRGFRSYGAVLAGYTVALIAMPAVDHPDSIFTFAMARFAVVLLGIACSALVGALLTGHTAAARISTSCCAACWPILSPAAALALRPGQAARCSRCRRAAGDAARRPRIRHPLRRRRKPPSVAARGAGPARRRRRLLWRADRRRRR